MPIIDVVKCDADALRADQVYAWRFPSQELSTWTQLIVNESQEAVLVRGGVMEGPFGPGRHTLSTENIPIISKLVNIPFGNRSPFTAEVWFVNRAIPLDVKWGTSEPIQLLDPKYNIMLPVRALGQYGVQIENSKKFLIKLVGVMSSFDREKLVSYFRGLILTRAKDCIAAAIVKDRISILEISAHLNSISESLRAELAKELPEYGLRLASFFVNSITTPDSDPAVSRLKMALARRAEMDIVGYTYQQERSFDTMERAAGNEGSAGNIMGAGLGLGMGVGMGVPMGNSMNQIAGNMQVSQVPAGASGTKPCGKCGVQNNADAKFCGGCGNSLNSPSAEHNCPKCGTATRTGAMFCSGCGTKLIISCIKCGQQLSPGAKFCASCGSPQ